MYFGRAVLVGHQASCVLFYSTSYRPHLWTGQGSWGDDEHIEFLYREYLFGIDRHHTVPRMAAREALRRFFTTGGRPNNLAWEIV